LLFDLDPLLKNGFPRACTAAANQVTACSQNYDTPPK